MTDSALLEHIAKQSKGRTNLKHLFKELRIKGDDRAKIEASLDRLSERGDLIELRNGNYTVTATSREFAVGRVSVHKDGFGFLIPDRPISGMQGDIYLSRDSIRGAMHGDRA